MTLATVKTARATAGTTYATAFAAFKAAYIELAACDAALNNGNFNTDAGLGAGNGSAYATFFLSDLDMNALRPFLHPDFLTTISRAWQSEIDTRRDAILAAGSTT